MSLYVRSRICNVKIHRLGWDWEFLMALQINKMHWFCWWVCERRLFWLNNCGGGDWNVKTKNYAFIAHTRKKESFFLSLLLFLTRLFGITLMPHKIELFYYFDIIILNDPIKTSNITHRTQRTVHNQMPYMLNHFKMICSHQSHFIFHFLCSGNIKLKKISDLFFFFLLYINSYTHPFLFILFYVWMCTCNANTSVFFSSSSSSVKPSMIPFFYAVKLLQHYYERLSFWCKNKYIFLHDGGKNEFSFVNTQKKIYSNIIAFLPHRSNPTTHKKKT